MHWHQTDKKSRFSELDVLFGFRFFYPAVSGLEPGMAGWEVQMLPLCYAVPPSAPSSIIYLMQSFRCKLIWITLQWKFQWKINCPGTGIRTLDLSITELSVSPRIERRWRKCRCTIFKGFWCFGSDGWSTKNFFWKKKKHPESLIFSDFESNRSSRVRNHKNAEYFSTKWLKWNVLGSSTGK